MQPRVVIASSEPITSKPCDGGHLSTRVRSGELSQLVSRQEATRMSGRSTWSVTDSGETTPGEQEERIMSSPGTRRPQVQEKADVTGPVPPQNRISAELPAAVWGPTEQPHVRNSVT